MNILVKFDFDFELKFEISEGKHLVKFLGRPFLPARKAREISERISGQISEQISGNFSETSFLSETLFSRRAVLKYFAIINSCQPELPWIRRCEDSAPKFRERGV